MHASQVMIAFVDDWDPRCHLYQAVSFHEDDEVSLSNLLCHLIHFQPEWMELDRLLNALMTNKQN